MTLADISAGFLTFIRLTESRSEGQSAIHEKVLALLTSYFSPNAAVSEITPARLRDFISRWYVEKACTSSFGETESLRSNARENATATPGGSRDSKPETADNAAVPNPRELLDSLAQFLNWVDHRAGANLAEQCSPILLELSDSLPRALEITNVLSRWLRERGGAFSFPEFLTSFEEGGHSEYDIDAPGNVGALEGYFRILRVEGSLVEAEEMISEERVWPIVFPPAVAALLDDQYIINLELVRSPAGWQIAGCGFAYPPETEV